MGVARNTHPTVNSEILKKALADPMAIELIGERTFGTEWGWGRKIINPRERCARVWPAWPSATSALTCPGLREPPRSRLKGPKRTYLASEPHEPHAPPGRPPQPRSLGCLCSGDTWPGHSDYFLPGEWHPREPSTSSISDSDAFMPPLPPLPPPPLPHFLLLPLYPLPSTSPSTPFLPPPSPFPSPPPASTVHHPDNTCHSPERIIHAGMH